MIERYDALLSLKEVGLEEKREALYRAFESEKFYAIRAEIVNQLAKDKDPHGILTIEKAFEDAAPQVRQAALNTMEIITEKQEPLVLKLLKDSSYTLVENAMDKLYNNFPEQATLILDLTKNDFGMANAVKIKWLTIAYMSGEKNAINQLIQYASGNYEFRTRINAMNSLKTLGVVNDALLKSIFSAALSWNGRLASPANDALNQLSMNAGNKKMISDYFKKNPWTPKELELIKEKGLKY